MYAKANQADEGPTVSAPTVLPRYRWVILFAVWGAFFLSFIDRLAWANVAVPVSQSLGLPLAALGSFVTAFYIGYLLTNAVGGFATDVLGGRLMITASLIPLGILTYCFSYTQSIAVGLVIQALMGLVVGADYGACIKLVMSWFGPKDRGRAIGLFFTGSSLAVVVANSTIPMFLRSFDWQSVYRILGAVTVVFGIICWLIVRDAPGGTARIHAQKPDFSTLWRNRNLMILSFAGFGGYWGTWGFAFWVNALLLKGHKIEAVEAGVIVAMFGVGAIIAKPVIGFISDKLGAKRRVPAIFCLLSFFFMLVVFGYLNSARAFLIAAPFLGVSAFIYTPLLAALVAESAGKELAGSATGITNAMWVLGNVIVPLAIGAVFQYSHSFHAAFIALALGPLVGALCLLFVREPKKEA